LYLADELIRCRGVLATIVADVVDVAVRVQGIEHLVHWLFEAVGLVVVVTILDAIGVVMPDHLHFIVVVHHDIVSSKGRDTHLGQVIAGFKKGCNRRYWELTGQTAQTWQGQPAIASHSETPLPAVYPQEAKIPYNGCTGRPPLFSYGYVDVMPLSLKSRKPAVSLLPLQASSSSLPVSPRANKTLLTVLSIKAILS